MSYLSRAVNPGEPTQREPIPGAGQVKNEAGGYVWAAGTWVRLHRWLILGSEGGAYYASESVLTAENVAALEEAVAEDPVAVLNLVVSVSEAGRAVKSDQTLFALARLFAGDVPLHVRSAAADALPRVARTSSHLFMFLSFVTKRRGWGRLLRRAVARWYTSRSPSRLAYQVTKYPARYGWSHGDAMLLSHPRLTGRQVPVVDWVRRGVVPPVGEDMAYIHGVVAAAECLAAGDPDVMADVIADFGLTREHVPTEALAWPKTWQAMLEADTLPYTAMLRNLGNMQRLGVLDDVGVQGLVLERLLSISRIFGSRVHPLQIVSAALAYGSGVGRRGQEWNPSPGVTDALWEAFHQSFGNVEPLAPEDHLLVGVDVSGSMRGMGWAEHSRTCLVQAAAVALVVQHMAGGQCHIMAFDTKPYVPPGEFDGMEDALSWFRSVGGGGTNCDLPIRWAADSGITDLTGVMVITDTETWAGGRHPARGLAYYRQDHNPSLRAACLAVVAYTTTMRSPDDLRYLDLVGFDPAAVRVGIDFIAGRL